MMRSEHDEKMPLPVIFEAESLGLSFRELGVDVARGEVTDILSRWFHSTQDADLFIYSDGKQRLLKLQLCFYGQVVEWNPLDGTRTGLIVEQEFATLGDAAKASAEFEFGSEEDVGETIQFDSRTQASVMMQAVSVLAHIPGLALDERALLIYNLQQSPRLHKKAKERALETWAPKAHEISSLQRPKFWKRMRKWVLG
jgi:hypothetical protein